ncbi:Hypothetical predicted protein [Podarcis lilfordi]|uniref:Uncharacterized protein n=1 Tax=Podarcis lilfordi TaxID=74358 RepID=A0AA35P8T8_9SAUR|nr:Hypothetical predicted protein [Podarcis lilfordi]
MEKLAEFHKKEMVHATVVACGLFVVLAARDSASFLSSNLLIHYGEKMKKKRLMDWPFQHPCLPPSKDLLWLPQPRALLPQQTSARKEVGVPPPSLLPWISAIPFSAGINTCEPHKHMQGFFQYMPAHNFHV